jgi:Phage protein (N4 Gp49/phage Sf6 gene 66) family
VKSYSDFVNKRADGGADIKTKHTNISGEPKMGTEQQVVDSLRVTDDLSKRVQKTEHRVSLDSMLKKIEFEEYLYPDHVQHMTICVLLLKNGFAVVGKSAPADPENFDVEMGKKFAKEDAIRELWGLEGYALRERLHAESQEVPGR